MKIQLHAKKLLLILIVYILSKNSSILAHFLFLDNYLHFALNTYQQYCSIFRLNPVRNLKSYQMYFHGQQVKA